MSIQMPHNFTHEWGTPLVEKGLISIELITENMLR